MRFSKGSDQPARTYSLIRAFASRLVKLLTEHHLEFLSLKRDCTDSSESALVNSHFVGNLMLWLNIFFLLFIRHLLHHVLKFCKAEVLLTISPMGNFHDFCRLLIFFQNCTNGLAVLNQKATRALDKKYI